MKDNNITVSATAVDAALTALVGEQGKNIFYDMYRLLFSAEERGYNAGCQAGFNEGHTVGECWGRGFQAREAAAFQAALQRAIDEINNAADVEAENERLVTIAFAALPADEDFYNALSAHYQRDE